MQVSVFTETLPMKTDFTLFFITFYGAIKTIKKQAIQKSVININIKT